MAARKKKKSSIKNRMIAYTVTISIIFSALAVRIAYIQFVHGEEYSQAVLDQQTKEKEITPRRGTIYDCNGKELAVSASVDTVVIDPVKIEKNGNGASVKNVLCEVLGVDGEILDKALAKKSRFEYIKKRIDAEQSQILRNYLDGKDENGKKFSEKEKKLYNITGVDLISDTKRYYPYGKLAAQVIGTIGSDNQGLEGLEHVYDDYLKGQVGKIVKSQPNTEEKSFDYEKYYDSKAGNSLTLTIDESIQRIVEKCLDEAAIENKAAKGACAVVMDPYSGAVLAMANSPSYNLNEPLEITDEETLEQLDKLKGDEYNKYYVEVTSKMKRNKPVVDTYEPGSTFKLITCAMALEENVTTLEDHYSCSGSLTVGGRNIHCWKTAGHGGQTFMKGLVNSCNPVLMSVGAKIGKENFIKNFKMFGFREPTGLDFPGEAVGSFHNEEKFSTVDLAVSSFGQSFQVTPLQMITAISSLINGGTLYKPYLVKEIKAADGSVIKSRQPEVIRHTVSKETSEKMKNVMETVVVESGSTAAVKGYRIGGKSGTSEKIPRGSGKYIGSFVGAAPIDDPKIICMVILDEPMGENYYGGVISGPVAGKIMSEVLQYYGIEPKYTEEELKEIDTTVPDVLTKEIDNAKNAVKGFSLVPAVRGSGSQVISQEPAPGTKVKSGSTVILYTGSKEETKKVKVPNVIGKTAEEANKDITNAGLTVKVTGKKNDKRSVVSQQNPPPDALTDEKGTVEITMQEKSEE